MENQQTIVLGNEGRACSPHRASGSMWRDLSGQRHSHDLREYVQSPFADHVIGVLLGSPLLITQWAEGKKNSALCGPGDIQLIPAGTEAHYEFGGRMDVFHVRFAPDVLHRVAQESDLAIDHPELRNIFRLHDPQLEHLCGALKIEQEKGYPNGRLFGDGLATALAVCLLRQYTSTPVRAPTFPRQLSATDLRSALDYLQDNLAREPSLAEIAAEVAISPYHFARLFKQSTGLAPHQYLTQKRVERARMLLQSGKHTVTSAAIEVGFTDRSHLHRHCKRLLGLSPSELLPQNRKIVHAE